jgi:hypothetical protein
VPDDFATAAYWGRKGNAIKADLKSARAANTREDNDRFPDESDFLHQEPDDLRPDSPERVAAGLWEAADPER